MSKNKIISNNITLKIKYTSENSDRILEFIKNYNNVLRFTYNRLYEAPMHNMKTKDLLAVINSMNNVFVDTYFKTGAMYEARALIKLNGDNKVIFGGKKLFIERCKNNISKEDFNIKKLLPLQVIGASHNNGNCKFQIIDKNTILFKPNKYEHFNLHLKSVGKNYQRYLNQLISAQNNKLLPITYKLGIEYIYITFDLSVLNPSVSTYTSITNRIFSIDMNPNYVGYSVIDWKNSDEFNIVESGVYSIKPLNDYEKSLNVSSDNSERLYITNKRKYETIQLAHLLTKKAKHFKCSIFAIEQLNMKSKDAEKGKHYNRCVNNQWNRNQFVQIIHKDCINYSIQLQEVMPNYTSFIGNLAYRYLQLPDMILASIEISRRAYEFYHQYIVEDTPINKNIIFNNSTISKNNIIKSLEEFNIIDSVENIKSLYKKLKKMKCNYRFPLESAVLVNSQSLLSLFDKHKYLNTYVFL